MIFELKYIGEVIGKHENLNDPRIKKILGFTAQLSIFDVMEVVDLEGNGFNTLNNNFNINTDEYYNKALKGNIGLSKVIVLNNLNNDLVQILTYPIYSTSNKIIGIILGVLNFKTIQESFNINLRTNSHFKNYILDFEGNYINSSIRTYNNFWKYLSEINLPKQDIERIKKDFSNNKEGIFSYEKNGVLSFGYYIPLENTDGYFVSERNNCMINKKIKLINQLTLKDEVVTIIFFFIILFSLFKYFKITNNKILAAHLETEENLELICKAAERSNHIIFTYNHNTKDLIFKTNNIDNIFKEKNISNVPESIISSGVIANESIKNFKNLFKYQDTDSTKEEQIKLIINGNEIWYNFVLYSVKDKSENSINAMGIIFDITKLKKQEKETQKKLEIYDKLIERALLYAKVDLKPNKLIELNGSIDFDNFLNNNIIPKVKKEQVEFVKNKFSDKDNLFENKKDISEIELNFKYKQEYIWISCIIYKIDISENSKILFVLNDINSRKNKEIILKNRAEIDGLTKIFNSSTIKLKIKKALFQNYSSDKKKALLLLDLDNFKLINDNFGHLYGDRVLIDIAAILKEKFNHDNIIGRMGGDEFIIFVNDFDYYSNDFESLMIELKTLLTKTYYENDKEITITASIDIAFSLDDGKFLKSYMKGQIKLYIKLKKMGKNNFLGDCEKDSVN